MRERKEEKERGLSRVLVAIDVLVWEIASVPTLEQSGAARCVVLNTLGCTHTLTATCTNTLYAQMHTCTNKHTLHTHTLKEVLLLFIVMRIGIFVKS